MNRVVVIGAGASGLAAAITAATYGAMVTVLEKNNKVGKKLLATGNGRCNVTNKNMSKDKFRSDNMSFVEQVINKYSTQDIIDFFDNISVKTRDINGYVYPYSLQASTVVDKLYNECKGLGVNIVTEIECRDIVINKDGSFKVLTSGENYFADKVIIATGLVASVGIKGDKIEENNVFALNIANKLGHNIKDVVPGLTGLKCNNPHLSKISGVRWECKISTLENQKIIYEDIGEVQFADYGVSGIVVFQNARFASKMLKNHRKTELNVDFMPEFSQNELKNQLLEDFEKFTDMSLYDILTGIFNNKLVTYLLLNGNFNGSIKAKDFNNIDKLIKVIKEHRLQITGTRGFEYAQVCAGGIDTTEIKETMESEKINNVYFTGEALDVDGMCGGYNLHFAFATGIEAGMNAGMEKK